MPFTVEKLPEEPIVLVKIKVGDQKDFERDFPPLVQRIAELVAGIEGPIYRITDLTEVNISFGELVLAMQQEYRSEMPGTAADPRIQVVLVTSSKLIEVGAEGVPKSIHYGGKQPPKIFPTMDEALAYARAELAKGK
jgi:hypothetical protein